MAFYADFAGYYERIFPFREPTLAFLEKWLPEDGDLLDIGCGTGGYCGRLAAAGRSVLGVDLDPHMISAAERDHPAARFALMDMASIGRLAADSFGGVYCIGNVLPHLPGAALGPFLSDVRRLLRPRGVWLFQTVNFDFMLGREHHVFPVREFPEDDLRFHRRYEADGDGNFRFLTLLEKGGAEIFRGEVTLHPRSGARCLESHLSAGFSLEGHFGDYNGAPFDPERSPAGIFIFRRVD